MAVMRMPRTCRPSRSRLTAMWADSISTEELRALLVAGQPVTVVDIREPAEREAGYIPGVTLDVAGGIPLFTA